MRDSRQRIPKTHRMLESKTPIPDFNKIWTYKAGITGFMQIIQMPGIDERNADRNILGDKESAFTRICFLVNGLHKNNGRDS